MKVHMKKVRSQHKTFSHWCFIVVPASQTVAQYRNHIDSKSRLCWDIFWLDLTPGITREEIPVDLREWRRFTPQQNTLLFSWDMVQAGTQASVCKTPQITPWINAWATSSHREQETVSKCCHNLRLRSQTVSQR